MDLLSRFKTDGTPVGDFDNLFLDFDSVPLDTPLADNDNSILANAPWANPGAVAQTTPVNKGLLQTAAVPKLSPPRTGPRNIVIPHPRDLVYRSPKYMKGTDVQALDRALWRAGVYKHTPGTPFRNAYGPGLRDQVKKFQLHAGLKADGVYGLATHKALAKFYDQRAIWLVAHAVPKPKATAADKIVAAAIIGYNYRDKIHYTQGPARMWLVRHKIPAVGIPQQLSIWEDCSSWATWLYWQAGLPDPNGFGYNGFGYTGTLANHGARIFTNIAPVGALNFYGSGYPYSHVSIRISNTGRIISHGSEGGPYLLDTYYRNDLRQTRRYF